MTTKEIVELWKNNRTEMRCLKWFQDNYPEAVKWAKNNNVDMIFLYAGNWHQATAIDAISNPYALNESFVLQEEPSGKWVEYDVKQDSEGAIEVVDWRFSLSLIDIAYTYATRKGMCPQFKFSELAPWFYLPYADHNDIPATLVKMKVWVKSTSPN